MLKLIEEDILYRLYIEIDTHIFPLAVIQDRGNNSLVLFSNNISKQNFLKIIVYALNNNLNKKIYRALGIISNTYYKDKLLSLILIEKSKEQTENNIFLKTITIEIIIRRYLVIINKEYNIIMPQLESISYLIANLVLNEKESKSKAKEIINIIYSYAVENNMDNLTIDDIIKALENSPLINHELLKLLETNTINNHQKRR